MPLPNPTRPGRWGRRRLIKKPDRQPEPLMEPCSASATAPAAAPPQRRDHLGDHATSTDVAPPPAQSKNAAKRAVKQAARREAKRLRRGGVAPPETDLLPPVDKRATGCHRHKVLLWHAGKGFKGWMPQCPPGVAPLRTVGSVVEQAFRVALQEKVRVHPSGRTDSGVTASGQVVQFDSVTTLDPTSALPAALNAELPSDCQVRCVSRAPPDFSAMACRWKRYVYTIPGGEAALVAFCRKVLQGTRERRQTVRPSPP